MPTNDRLDWKGLSGTNALAYSASLSATKKKSFITFATDERSAKPEAATLGRDLRIRRHDAAPKNVGLFREMTDPGG